MGKPVLVVMARWPAIGRCKKRLSANLGAKKAAWIQAQLTKHTIQVAKSFSKKAQVEIHFAISGLGPRAIKRWGKVNGLESFSMQGEGSLGLRMRRQVLLVQRKYTKNRTTILIGTDLPELSTLDLHQALEALNRNEIVLGPASDGGYWLIGLSGRQIAPVATWPFCGIPWGTNQVLAKTLQKAKLSGAEYALLREHNDLDLLTDFSPWQK